MTSDRRIPESILGDIRARVDLARLVARTVRLERKGKGWQGCCPFHAENSPSFHVYADHVHCFGCGAHHDTIGYLQRVERIPFVEAAARLAAEHGIAIEAGATVGRWTAAEAAPASTPAVPAAAPDHDKRTAWAARVWREARPIAPQGSVASYLAARRLWPLPETALAVLREARAPHPEHVAALEKQGLSRDAARRQAPALPCLVARVDGPDGALRAVHRTWVAEQDGAWRKLPGVRDAKLSLGPISGGAVRLFPAAARLGLAEGIETALAASALHRGMPVWSCIAAPFLEAVKLPFEVEDVVIFADLDLPKGRPEGTGLRVARALAERLAALAVRVEIRRPHDPPPRDYADVWLGMAA